MQHFEIKPDTVPNTNQRMVVISEADLNRLRSLIADTIYTYENATKMYKKAARYYKQDGMKDESKQVYKDADKINEKVKKLAKISAVLKYNTLNNKEVVQNFNDVGVSLVNKTGLDLTIQQASAWFAVVDLIDQRVQKWYSYGNTGKEAALNILKRFLPKKPQE